MNIKIWEIVLIGIAFSNSLNIIISYNRLIKFVTQLFDFKYKAKRNIEIIWDIRLIRLYYFNLLNSNTPLIT